MRNAAGKCTARAWQKRHAFFKTFARLPMARFVCRGMIKTRIVMALMGKLFPEVSKYQGNPSPRFEIRRKSEIRSPNAGGPNDEHRISGFFRISGFGLRDSSPFCFDFARTKACHSASPAPRA
jgi:hypothetical protein